MQDWLIFLFSHINQKKLVALHLKNSNLKNINLSAMLTH